MWKYRNRGILGGWNSAALWIAFFVWLASGLVIYGLDHQDPERTFPKAIYALPFVLAAAVILVRAVLFRKEQHEDDEYLAKAVFPEWRRLPPDSEIVSRMRETSKQYFQVCLFLVVIPLLLAFFLLLRYGPTRLYLTTVCTIMVLWLLATAYQGVRFLFWEHTPLELEYTVIDVAYCSEHRYTVRSDMRKDISLYYFLPDGRYRVVLHCEKMEKKPPESLYFVRLHGLVRWIHWEDN